MIPVMIWILNVILKLNCLPSLANRNVQFPANNEYDKFIARHGVFEVLVWKCEGSFLYAFYVQSELILIRLRVRR